LPWLRAAAQASSQAQASSAPRPLHIDRSAHLPSTVLPHLPRASNVTYTNWGGYAAVANSGIKLRYVQAEFNVPSIDCARSLPGTSGYSYVAHWVGLDGYNGSTVEQTGVEAYCHGTSSAPVYFAWYEMYPQLPVVFSGIYPGDAIDASVYWNGSSYALHLLDQTANAQFNVNQSCPAGSTCRDNSAEVITEDPGGAVPSYNLPAFGSENYDGATVTSRSGTGGHAGRQDRLLVHQQDHDG
jgi:hypothetical protein